MQKTKDALMALSGSCPMSGTHHRAVCAVACLEMGYDDFRNLREDSDVDYIKRDPRFEVTVVYRKSLLEQCKLRPYCRATKARILSTPW